MKEVVEIDIEMRRGEDGDRGGKERAEIVGRKMKKKKTRQVSCTTGPNRFGPDLTRWV